MNREHVEEKMKEIFRQVYQPVINNANSPCFVDFVPTHHCRRTTAENLDKKLHRAGMQIRSCHFSIEEDERIQGNWGEYCKITGTYAVSDGHKILGQAKFKGKKTVNDPFFYPMICKGLIDRTCAQVLRRARRIFSETLAIGTMDVQLNDEEHAAQKFYYALSKEFAHDAIEVAAMKRSSRRDYEKMVEWQEVRKKCEWSLEKSNGFWKQLKAFIRPWSKENLITDPTKIIEALPNSLLKNAFKSKPFIRGVYSSKELLKALENFMVQQRNWLKTKYNASKFTRKFITQNNGDFSYSKCRLMASKLRKWLRLCEKEHLFNDLKKTRASFYYKLRALKGHIKRQINQEDHSSSIIDSVNTYLINKRWYQLEPELSD